VREKGDVAGGEQARIDGRLVLVDIEAGAEDAAASSASARAASSTTGRGRC